MSVVDAVDSMRTNAVKPLSGFVMVRRRPRLRGPIG